jgi:sulfur carrier protein
MTVTVNGEPRDVATGTTIADVVTSVTAAPSGVAVAVNGVVVARARWSGTALAHDDAVEILTAVQGG